jgi:excisionase family DNA binding protein
MEKICIVKRRRIGFETSNTPLPDCASRASSQILTIELTPEQMKRVRSDDHFRELYGVSQAPILLSLHLETPFPMKMLKPDQICDMLQISKSTLKRLVNTGAFKSRRIGRLRRFALDDVLGYLGNDPQTTDLRSIHGANAP